MALRALSALSLALLGSASRVQSVSKEQLELRKAEPGLAYDVLCEEGKQLGTRTLLEDSCSTFKFCQRLSITCSPDQRVAEIEVKWHQNRVGSVHLSNLLKPHGWHIVDDLAEMTGVLKSFTVDTEASPIEEGAEPDLYRFFLKSDGCKSDAYNCEFPWDDEEAVRDKQATASITRWFLLYDKRVPGKPKASIEVSHYDGIFSASSFELKGTGRKALIPEVPIFAGQQGTSCKAFAGCARPVEHTSLPVSKETWNVTTYHLMEYPKGSGNIQVKSNWNYASMEQTRVFPFVQDMRLLSVNQ